MDAARLYDQYAQRAIKNQEQRERSTDHRLQRVAMAQGGASCGSWSCMMIRYARYAACKHRQRWTTLHQRRAVEPTRSATYKVSASDATVRKQQRKTATGSGRMKAPPQRRKACFTTLRNQIKTPLTTSKRRFGAKIWFRKTQGGAVKSLQP